MTKLLIAEPKVQVSLELTGFPQLGLKSIKELQMALKSSIADAILTTLEDQETLPGGEVSLGFQIAFADQNLKTYLN